MKKVFTFILALALLVSTGSAFAKGSFSLWVGLNSPVTATSNDLVAWKEMQERLGITIDFINPPIGTDKENFTLMVSDPDSLPDAIYYNWSTFPGGPTAAIENEIIIPLTDDVLKTYAPNYWAYLEKYPDIKKMVTTDAGVHYQIPSIMTWEVDESLGYTPLIERAPAYEAWQGLIIRKDYLNAYGLEVPKTIADWTNVLTVFKKNNIASPFSPVPATLRATNAFAGAYGIGLDLYADENNQVHFGPIEEGYAQYLTLLNEWYTQGLLDPDFAALDGDSSKAKAISGESGAWVGTAGGWLGTIYESAHEINKDTSFDVVAVAPPVLNESDDMPQYAFKAFPYSGSGLSVTSSCENIGQVLSAIDYFWSDEGQLLANWGLENQNYVFNKNGLPEYIIPEGQTVAATIDKVYILNGPLPSDMRTRQFQMTLYSTPAAYDAREIWAKAKLPSALPAVVIPADMATDYATYRNDITTYVNEMHMKFVMGLEPLENMEAFRTVLAKMGVNDYIAIAQKALDNYNAR